MILLRDALRLSLTKLRIRIIRLVITIIIASILFALAVFTVCVLHGAVSSVKNLNQEGLSNRYLVVGQSMSNGVDFNDPQLISLVEKAQIDIKAKKVAEAKRVGIEYDPKQDTPWVESYPDGTKVLSWSTPEVAKIMDDYSKSNLELSYATFEEKAKAAGAIATYRISNENGNGVNLSPSSGKLKAIKDGQESFKASDSTSSDPNSLKGFDSISGGTMRVSDESLLIPYILPGQTLTVDNKDGSIPAIVPYSVAVEALGYKALTDSSTATEKLNRLREVRSKVAGVRVSVCYRNSTSNDQIESTIAQKKDIESNKNIKGYEKPLLITDLPQEACGPVQTVSDKRTAEQKKQDTKQLQFDELFGKQPPDSRMLTVRIVGVVPDPGDMYANSVTSILSSIMSTSIGSGWIVPAKVSTDPKLKGFVSDIASGNALSVQYIAELRDSTAQKKFINQQSCDYMDGLGGVEPVNITPGGPNDPATICSKQGKPYVYRSFGNNAAAIDEFEKGFNDVFNIILLVLAILSSFVMMGTIGRIVADSRRETAVFRAIGATRLDMTLVYGLYALMMATLVAVFAIAVGWFAAIIFSNYFGPQITPTALLIFNVADLHKEFTFLSFDGARILLVGVVLYAATLIGLILPLATNLRRSPLKDMRDEN